MNYQYQQEHRFFAQTAPGLESAAAEELAALGADPVEARFMGVFFGADKAALIGDAGECIRAAGDRDQSQQREFGPDSSARCGSHVEAVQGRADSSID